MQRKSLVPLNAGLRSFFFLSLPKASFCRSKNKKAFLRQQQGFFFVDKRFEKSNLGLIRDMADIIKLEKDVIYYSSPYESYFCI